jgi:uncharacterized membrane protein SirB2
MNLYGFIKVIHVSCVVLSISGFVLRGIWLMRDSLLLQHRYTKRLPHVVDTLLLASALVMVFMSGQYPFVENWLTAKVVALLVYISLGFVAMRFGKTKRVRITTWALAILVFGYIVAVALSRSVSPGL